jgi:hypothetical protein
VSALPQVPQNRRTTPGEDWNTAGLPAVISKLCRLKVSQATVGAPLARRQLAQWHMTDDDGSPVTR